MTYLVSRSKLSRARPRARAAGPLSGILDFLEDIATPGLAQVRTASESAGSPCLNAATAETADFDAKTDDLSRTWTPNGFYSPGDVYSLVNQTLGILAQGTAALDKVLAGDFPQSAKDALVMVRSQTQDKVTQGAVFAQAVTTAKTTGANVIDAPGLKHWIVTSMSAASVALNSASFVVCEQPWWVSALLFFKSAFDVLYAVCKAIVGAVVKFGEVVLKVPDALGTMLTYAKWGALIGGAAFLYYELDKRRQA